jgi:hypothetical protein
MANEDDPKWLYKVDHYKDGQRVMVTVHATEGSKDMEVEASLSLGWTVQVFQRRLPDRAWHLLTEAGEAAQAAR